MRRNNTAQFYRRCTEAFWQSLNASWLCNSNKIHNDMRNDNKTVIKRVSRCVAETECAPFISTYIRASASLRMTQQCASNSDAMSAVEMRQQRTDARWRLIYTAAVFISSSSSSSKRSTQIRNIKTMTHSWYSMHVGNTTQTLTQPTDNGLCSTQASHCLNYQQLVVHTSYSRLLYHIY